jgi:hypothetical protein
LPMKPPPDFGAGAAGAVSADSAIVRFLVRSHAATGIEQVLCQQAESL